MVKAVADGDGADEGCDGFDEVGNDDEGGGDGRRWWLRWRMAKLLTGSRGALTTNSWRRSTRDEILDSLIKD